MLKIRLARIGRRNDPTFRVVVTNSQNGPKAGKHTELLGTHNPKVKETSLNAERIKYWMSKGAQVSDTVHNLLITHKVLDGKKINALPKKSPIIKEKEESKETSTPESASAIPEAIAEETSEVTKQTSTEIPTEEAVAETSVESENSKQE